LRDQVDVFPASEPCFRGSDRCEQLKEKQILQGPLHAKTGKSIEKPSKFLVG